VDFVLLLQDEGLVNGLGLSSNLVEGIQHHRWSHWSAFPLLQVFLLLLLPILITLG